MAMASLVSMKLSSSFNRRPLSPSRFPSSIHNNGIRTLTTSAAPRSTTMELKKSISNQSDFGLRMTKQLFLNQGAKERNMVYSPLSIHVVLSLIAAAQRIPPRKSCSLSSMPSPPPTSTPLPLVFADGSPSGGPFLSFTNGLWVDKSLPLSCFKEVMDSFYKAARKEVGFQTKAEEVRVESVGAGNETRGLIKEVLSPGSVNSITKAHQFANALKTSEVCLSPSQWQIIS